MRGDDRIYGIPHAGVIILCGEIDHDGVGIRQDQIAVFQHRNLTQRIEREESRGTQIRPGNHFIVERQLQHAQQELNAVAVARQGQAVKRDRRVRHDAFIGSFGVEAIAPRKKIKITFEFAARFWIEAELGGKQKRLSPNRGHSVSLARGSCRVSIVMAAATPAWASHWHWRYNRRIDDTGASEILVKLYESCSAFLFNVALLSWLPAALAAGTLPQLGAELPQTSVSGLSSGGYMAGQFHTAHSKYVKGAAIVATGPYACARSGVAYSVSVFAIVVAANLAPRRAA
jgi:hypothetical protein